ncbi:GGDEF domain-containing protein [Thiocapsa bogorovii]|nr:GGDEF domain-containing protein [Thiocapsa bogorovii]
MRSSVREVDTAARLGGDEFALVLPNTDGSGAKHVISHLTGKLHRAFGPDDRRITCSIGVVTFLDSVISPEQAVAAADDLMYRVKREAKGTVLFSVNGQSVQHRAAAGFSPAERRRAGTLS